MFTNDPDNGYIKLSITGEVVNFVQMDPKFARLRGYEGDDIKTTITLTQEKDYPFKILKVKAQKGENITVKLEDLNKETEKSFFQKIASFFRTPEQEQPDKDRKGSYLLTIENRKTTAGRYNDKLILVTDSEIKPTLTVPVTGLIRAVEPDKGAQSDKEAAKE